MSLDKIKKLLKQNEEEGQVVADGTLADLGELPKFGYGSVDARGGSKKLKTPKKSKKKKDNTHETEDFDFDFFPKGIQDWKDKWDKILKSENFKGVEEEDYTIDDYFNGLKVGTIVFGVNGIDLKNVYNQDEGTIRRLEKYSGDYLIKCKEIIRKIKERFNVYNSGSDVDNIEDIEDTPEKKTFTYEPEVTKYDETLSDTSDLKEGEKITPSKDFSENVLDKAKMLLNEDYSIYPETMSFDDLEKDPDYIYEDDKDNINVILEYLGVEDNYLINNTIFSSRSDIGFLFVKEDDGNLVVTYAGDGSPELNEDLYLIQKQ